jgi:hypothetical protein
VTSEPQRQLSRLEDLLSSLDAAGSEEYVGGRLMRAGLEHMRTRLVQQQIVAAHSDFTTSLDLGLEPAVQAEGAELTLVGAILNEIQESIAALAQSIRDRPTARGVVPEDIQSLVRMRVAFALPGSLSLRIVPVPAIEPMRLTDDRDQPSLLHQSIEALFGLLGGDHGNPDGFLDGLAAAGPRAMSHLATLTGTLEKSGASLGLRWRHQGSRAAVDVTAADAQRLGELLKQVVEEERERLYRGRLVGGSLVRGTFELELNDETIISGRVPDDLLGSVEELFGQDCVAEVLIREARLPSGETREAVSLQRLYR